MSTLGLTPPLVQWCPPRAWVTPQAVKKSTGLSKEEGASSPHPHLCRFVSPHAKACDAGRALLG